MIFSAAGIAAISVTFALSSCSTQEEMATKPAATPAAPATAAAPAAEAKAPAKAKAEKAKGDVGLLDTEKNYMILVTKEGKLVTLDFDAKTKVTQVTPTPGKIADIGLGSSAVVTYTKSGEKNVASGVEYRPAKGGE
jgi:outer membrane protease